MTGLCVIDYYWFVFSSQKISLLKIMPNVFVAIQLCPINEGSYSATFISGHVKVSLLTDRMTDTCTEYLDKCTQN